MSFEAVTFKMPTPYMQTGMDEDVIPRFVELGEIGRHLAYYNDKLTSYNTAKRHYAQIKRIASEGTLGRLAASVHFMPMPDIVTQLSSEIEILADQIATLYDRRSTLNDDLDELLEGKRIAVVPIRSEPLIVLTERSFSKPSELIRSTEAFVGTVKGLDESEVFMIKSGFRTRTQRTKFSPVSLNDSSQPAVWQQDFSIEPV